MMNGSNSSSIGMDKNRDADLEQSGGSDDVERVVGLLRDIRIWADLENGSELRAIALPVELREIRYFDGSDGLIIATVTDASGKAFTAFDVADVLTWHVDHRDQRWASSRIKARSIDTLELWVEFEDETA